MHIAFKSTDFRVQKATPNASDFWNERHSKWSFFPIFRKNAQKNSNCAIFCEKRAYRIQNHRFRGEKNDPKFLRFLEQTPLKMIVFSTSQKKTHKKFNLCNSLRKSCISHSNPPILGCANRPQFLHISETNAIQNRRLFYFSTTKKQSAWEPLLIQRAIPKLAIFKNSPPTPPPVRLQLPSAPPPAAAALETDPTPVAHRRRWRQWPTANAGCASARQSSEFSDQRVSRCYSPREGGGC